MSLTPLTGSIRLHIALHYQPNAMKNKAILENGKLNPLCLMPGDVVGYKWDGRQIPQMVKDAIFDHRGGMSVVNILPADLGMESKNFLPHSAPTGYELRNDEDTRKLLNRMGFVLYDEDEEMIFYERRVVSGDVPARGKDYATLYLEFDKDELKWYAHWKGESCHFSERHYLRQVTYLHEVQLLYLAMSGEKLLLNPPSEKP